MSKSTKNQISVKVTSLKEFEAGLRRVTAHTAKSGTVPAANMIHLQARDNTLILTATDGASTVQIVRSGVLETDEPVSLTVPKLLADIVRKLPSKGDTELRTDGTKMEILSGKSSFTLSVLDGSEFPAYTRQPLDRHFRVSGETFAAALKKVVYATAVSETRPVLTAVKIAGKGNTVQLVATDSHRMSAASFTADETLEEFNNILVSGSSAGEIIKICDSFDGELDVEFSEQQLRVTAGPVVFSTRLMNGTYPDVQRIIPQNFKTDVTLKREELMKALERASVLKEKDTGVRVKLTVQNGTVPVLLIETVHAQIGKMKEELFVETTGEISLHVNAAYLHEALNAMDSADVKIRFNGAFDPFVLVPVQSSGCTALILPIRVNA